MCRQASFDALVDEARKRGLPRYFDVDLYYHDRNALEEYKPSVFGWMLRECGTHLFLPHWRDIDWMEAAFKTWPDGLCYWWNGETLEPVSPTELRVLMAAHAAPRAPWE